MDSWKRVLRNLFRLQNQKMAIALERLIHLATGWFSVNYGQIYETSRSRTTRENILSFVCGRYCSQIEGWTFNKTETSIFLLSWMYSHNLPCYWMKRMCSKSLCDWTGYVVSHLMKEDVKSRIPHFLFIVMLVVHDDIWINDWKIPLL